MAEKTKRRPNGDKAKQPTDEGARPFAYREVIPKPPTPTQLKIIDMYVHGKIRKEIAYELGISLSSVDTQLARLYVNFGVHSFEELTSFYRRHPELQKAHGVNIPEERQP
ncbi:MAG: helix-turn-helix transcriptional regulator [Candidatus Micrarchaeaceae archaeon]|nr:helix-turn-helix transcriptional regulator [Candidatus Micrarchaeota archaeon]HII10295.1 helix-turn-helix transcriptional regulator [Candidatus Micrarchaeota archaeon]